MSRPLVVQADVEQDAVDYLTEALSVRVEDYAQNVEVHVRTPTVRPGRLVTIRRAGGAGEYLLDRPRLSVSVWHETDTQAHDLAALTLGLLWQMRGYATFRGMTVQSGLVPAPDLDGTARYLLTVQFTCKGATP